ncbi:spermidine/putrescine ABC transporter [Erysipelothrix piscisicarius]|uniref:Spermidine/putrescine ABC transporter n=1 Tax=Erysipelothrix piscisicarius TaxID=2485784 RepID=A0A3Q8S2Z0_9FIRM|nr:spermidine/putrescine ABC transporter [Erysipelothrix piscisicarius]AZK44421.1 spermidine/putrescine ABC transporter [Erysipelothrix piscisicarius]
MMGRPKGGLNNKWTYEDRIKVVTRHIDEHISAAKLSQVLKERLMVGLIDSCVMVRGLKQEKTGNHFLRFIRVNH